MVVVGAILSLLALPGFNRDLQAPVGSVMIELDKPVEVGVASTPIVVSGNRLSIISLGEAIFSIDKGSSGFDSRDGSPPNPVAPRFTARLKMSAVQYNRVDYRVSCAVFNKSHKLLGVAPHVESVHYIRLGIMPTLFRDVTLDFGSSKAFRGACYAVFSISEPEVPRAVDG